MTRAQFLNDLYHHLYGLTQDQAEQHLTYYAEMLADRMEEGMSEEDAVASMEDVETIARRVMEGEGLPYTPPDQRPAALSVSPDPSRPGGGGGTRAYQAPKQVKWWKDWRRISQIALWTVSIIAVIGAVNHWRWNRSHTADPEPALESRTMEAPPAEEYWDYGEAPLAEGFDYPNGETHFAPGDVESIEVEWAAGTVSVNSWSEDTICVTEYFQSEPSERTRMELSVEGETLNIRYRKGGGLLNVRDQKWLEILIPDGMMGKIGISAASADVQVYGMELDALRIGTASGSVTADQCYTQATGIQTVSGEVMCNNVYAGQVEIATTSGGIFGSIYTKNVKASSISGDIHLDGLEEVETLELHTTSGDIWTSIYDDATARGIRIESVSGDVSLGLPSGLGFTLNYATVSGEVNVSNFDGGIRGKSGSYTYDGGGCEINVSTTSGDVEIY